MKILHLLSTSKWTGAAEPVLLLCKELSKAGHEIHLAFSQLFEGWRLSKQRGLGYWKKRAQPGGRPGLAEKAAELGLQVRPDIYLNTYANIRQNWNDFQVIRRIIRQEGIQILHCHLSHAYHLGALCRPPRGCRIIYTHHPKHPIRNDIIHRWLVRNRTDHIMTYSPEVAEACIRDFDLPKDKVSLLLGGIDTGAIPEGLSGLEFRKKWNIPEGCLVFGMAARMQKRRDHETLLRSFACLKPSPERARLVLIGDGEYRENLIALASELEISDRVIFTGYLKEEYFSALSALDVFVYTAPGSDASCRAVMEAMALGKPVIGVNSAALPLLIEPGKDGYLFPASDSDQLAEHMGQFIHNPWLVSEFGHRCKAKAFQELTLQRVAHSVESVYKQISQG